MEMRQTDSNYSSSTPVIDVGSDAADRITYVTSRVVFAVILVGGLVANGVLIGHVVRGQRRLGSRAPPQLNLFVVALHAAANLVNCLANGVWMVYTAAVGRDADVYLTTGCRLDAAAVQMIVIIHALGLALMSVDRLAAVRSAGHPGEQRGFMLSRAALLIALAWMYSIGLSLPLVVPNGVEIEGSSQRYLCTVDSHAPAAYVWTTMTIGYVCPTGVVVAMLVGTVLSAAQHRRKLAASRIFDGPIDAVSSPADDGPDRHHPDPAVGLSVEVNAAKYVGCLCVAWCVFVLPFPVLSLVRIGRTAAASRAFSYGKDVDAIVTWLFISHPVLLPAITLVWRKNVCCRCIHRLRRCCRDGDPGAEISSTTRSPTITPKRRQRLGEVHPFYISPGRGAIGGGFDAGSGFSDGRSVPVLFATPHGLHIRSSSDPTASGDRIAAAVSGEKGPSIAAGGDEARKCDVFGSVYALQTDEDDLLNTSDYDSGDEDAVGGAGDSTRAGTRSVDVRARDQDDVPAGSNNPRTPSSAELNLVTCGIGEQRATGRSIWYDGEVETHTRADRLVDSGVGTMKKSSCADGQSGSKETSLCSSGDVRGRPAASATVQVSPASSTQPEVAVAKPKKRKQKAESDGRSTRKVADADALHDHARKEGKEVGSERTKSAKTASRAADSRSRRPEDRRQSEGGGRTEDPSPPTADQPVFRSLPKIVITGVVDGEDEDQTSSSSSSSSSLSAEELSDRRRRRRRRRRRK